MIYTQKIVNLSSCLQILHFRQIMVNIACMNKDLKQLVKEECKFMPSDALVERFLGAMEEIQVKPRRRIIDFGKICTDVFCVKSGIVRLSMWTTPRSRPSALPLPVRYSCRRSRFTSTHRPF